MQFENFVDRHTNGEMSFRESAWGLLPEREGSELDGKNGDDIIVGSPISRHRSAALWVSSEDQVSFEKSM